MPKKKTKKAAAKRFKITASGKVKYAHAGRGHLLSGKTRKRKRGLRKAGIVCPADEKRILTLLQ
ncbi:MAG: 50S ribosomal protein L35 [Lentisphaerales bacterium]|jgi:large subunit ribosomal protein L35|nr:MAG: 50S ribosomal protein L35 [Lentisphaerales bacterium]